MSGPRECRRWQAALVLLLCSLPLRAHAEEWAARCKTLFEHARTELAKKHPDFAKAAVTSDVAPGDTRNPVTFDPLRRPAVFFQLGPSSGRPDDPPLYLATISVLIDERDRVDAWESMPNKAYSGFDWRERRGQHGRAAFLGVRGELLKPFVEQIKRAADACLALP